MSWPGLLLVCLGAFICILVVLDWCQAADEARQ